MSKLTVAKVKGRLAPGMHNDGGGLYLHVSQTGAKSWILRTRVHGKRTDIGLGSAQLVPLKQARDKAIEYRGIARAGGDPLAMKRRGREIPTFEQAATRVWEEQVAPTARNEKHKAQWLTSLRTHAFPVLADRRVDTLTSADVLAVLQPIWLDKPETARRIRQRLRTVFDWAIAARHRSEANPVAGIETALARQTDRARHFAALPVDDLPALIARLEAAGGIGALAVRFCILTAARSGEVRGARWEEIDLAAGVWTVPETRMKGKREHRVPLTDAAIAVLEAAQGLDRDLVFPGQSRGKPMSDMTLAAVLKRLGVPVTVHGMRSTFRDWAWERTSVPREIAELCLAHQVGSAVERAYARSDLFDKRRDLLERWARFATGETGIVVELPA